MKKPITRRDFLNGSLMTLGALGFPAVTWAEALHPFAPNELYPPRLTGMRGSHPRRSIFARFDAPGWR